MKQASLKFSPGGSTRQKESARLKTLAGYDEGNLRAARVILEGGSKYRGLTLEWARIIIMRLGTPEEKSSL